jgi:hypothetical protein
MDTGIRTLTEQDIKVLSATKMTQYGALGMTGDGRFYRYVGFGGTSTIAPGQLLVAPTTVAAYQGLAITATTVTTATQVAANLVAGSNTIILTNGATAVTQDQFAEGYLELLVGSAGTSGAYSLRIKGNSAAGAAGFITVTLAEPLVNTVALVPGTDTANLNVSVYSGTAASATAAVAVGVTVVPVPNTAAITNYGWVQTGGPCDVLNDAGGTITVGGGFAQSTTTAGSVVASTASTAPAIGTTRKAITASNVGPGFLKLI